MSTIVTTRTYQQGDNFTFTVAAKNGYGINVNAIPSMSQYLNDEDINSLGSVFPGGYNSDLYPGVRITGQLNNISVNYNINLDNSSCRQLEYFVKFNRGTHPITGDLIYFDTPAESIDHYLWIPNPLTLQTPSGSQIPSDIIFTSWYCSNDNRYYVAGSQVYVNDDLEFTAVWQPAPVSVGVESDTESSTIPEFENE